MVKNLDKREGKTMKGLEKFWRIFGFLPTAILAKTFRDFHVYPPP